MGRRRRVFLEAQGRAGRERTAVDEPKKWKLRRADNFEEGAKRRRGQGLRAGGRRYETCARSGVAEVRD
jgi:hypothetical protein